MTVLENSQIGTRKGRFPRHKCPQRTVAVEDAPNAKTARPGRIRTRRLDSEAVSLATHTARVTDEPLVHTSAKLLPRLKVVVAQFGRDRPLRRFNR